MMFGTSEDQPSGKQLYVIIGVFVIVSIAVALAPSFHWGDARPFDSIAARAMLAGAVPVGVLAFAAIGIRARKVINSRIATALAGLQNGSQSSPLGATTGGNADPGVTAAGVAQATKALEGRFQDALAILKKRRFSSSKGRRWLYQLPWYVIVGPPGSGKTTAITNSGLTFPLADRFGKTAVSGIGGTRSCDWWFTDDAVLIDTAGRYTTQDSNAEQDQAGWLGFLRLLRKFRRRQPLNGVLVAIGIRDITSASEATRQDHASRIRKRIGELYRELGARLPIYLLFTKVDLIAGFTEYFDDLGREGRESVWGMTFDLENPEPEGGYATRYENEFESLVARLDERLIERVQQENDVGRRGLVFGFPHQMLSLKEITRQFLYDTFETNSFEEPILLRGVYFVSGTQIGTPLDRVTEATSRTFGVEMPPPLPLTGKARSFFLSRLLSDVVFGEAGLVDADVRIEQRLQRLRRAAFAAVGAVTVVISALWLLSYMSNLALIARVRSVAAEYANQAGGMQLEQVSNPDLRSVVPLLDLLRDGGTADGGQAQSRARFLRSAFGLDQDRKLGMQTRDAYQDALNRVLLPRLILRLENQLTTHAGDPEFLYPGLKVYLMLGHQGPLDRDFVKRWLGLDFASSFPSDDDADLRRSLGRHVDALLAGPISAVPLDSGLIETTRETLRQDPPARRLEDALVTSAAAVNLPVWTIANAAGPAGGVFQRRSGQSLDAGIPGIYTSDGFRGTFLPALPAAAQAVLNDNWVLGDQGSDGSDIMSLERDATGLYLQAFGRQWDQLLADIEIAPPTGLDSALETLGTLSGPTSPLRQLVVSMAYETALDQPSNRTPGQPVSGAADGTDNLATLFDTGPGADTPAGIAASFSRDHFGSLQQLVDVPANSAPGAQPQIDAVLQTLLNLYQSLVQMQQAGGQSQPAGSASGAVLQSTLGAAGLPEPIKHWILGVTDTSATLSFNQATNKLSALWSGTAGQFCDQATSGRYPFVTGATDEISPGDFTKLFAKGGAIDAFFTANLIAAADMSRQPWRWQTEGTGLVLNPSSIAQFERAAEIRDSMFGGDATSPEAAAPAAGPEVGLEVGVIGIDPAVSRVTFRLGDKTLVAGQNDPDTTRFIWTGDPTDTASISIEGSGGPATLSNSGAWALFRLLDQASVMEDGAPDRFRVQFDVAGHPVTLLLEAESVKNPFSGTLLEGFHCSKTL